MLAGLKPRLFDELKDYGSKWIYELPKVVWGLCTQQSRAMFTVVDVKHKPSI